MKRNLQLVWFYLKRYWPSYILGLISLFAVDYLVTVMPLLTAQVYPVFTISAASCFRTIPRKGLRTDFPDK